MKNFGVDYKPFLNYKLTSTNNSPLTTHPIRYVVHNLFSFFWFRRSFQEGVGPDRAYNLCRLITSKTLVSTGSDDESIAHEDASYGWFPIRWLQKLEHYNATIQQQQADSDDVAS